VTLSVGHFIRAGSGTVLSQIVALICVPILFRLYSPEAFGAWAATMAVVLGIGSVATLRYELAIVLEREHAAASGVFWLTLLVGITFSLLGGGLISIFGSRILFAGDVPPAQVLAVCVWVVLVAIGQAMQGWLLRDGAFGANSQIQVCNALVTNGVHLLGGWLSGSPLWLIIGSIIGQIAGVSFALSRLCKAPPMRMAGGWAALREAAIKHHRFPFFSAPFTLLTIARERAPILVLAAFASPAQVGFYSQAWRLVNIPVGLTSGALRPVLFHAAAAEGLAAQEMRIARILMVIALLGAPWLGVLAYDPQAAFGMILGEAWRNAGMLAAILAVPAFFFALSNWMDRFLDLQARQDINLWTELVATVLSVGVLWLCLYNDVGLITAASIQALVLAFCYVGFMVVTYRVIGFSRGTLVKVIALSIGLAVLFGGLTFIVGAQSFSIMFTLILSAGVAALFGMIMVVRSWQGLR